MLNNNKKPRKELIDTVEHTIQAYNSMRAHCLHQVKEAKSAEMEDRLMRTIWECDATILSLQAIVERISPANNNGASQTAEV